MLLLDSLYVPFLLYLEISTKIILILFCFSVKDQIFFCKWRPLNSNPVLQNSQNPDTINYSHQDEGNYRSETYEKSRKLQRNECQNLWNKCNRCVKVQIWFGACQRFMWQCLEEKNISPRWTYVSFTFFWLEIAETA